MFKVSVREIMDYCFCPHFYKMKYVDKVIHENITDYYEKILKQCFYAYLNSLKNNGKVNITYLTRLWGKYWIKDGSTVKVMASPSGNSRDRYDTLRKAGIKAVISFDKMVSSGEQFPLMVHKQYTVNIGKISLTGDFEYVRQHGMYTENECFQVIKFGYRDSYMTAYQMSNDLELTAAAYAFKTIFNTEDAPVKTMWFNISKERVIETEKTEEDYQKMKETITGAAKCINSKIFPACPDARCYICSYRNQCRI